MKLIFSAAVICTGLLPALLHAENAHKLEGIFGLPGWDCQSVGSDGGAIEFAEGTFVGVESNCLMENPVKVRGMNAVLFDRTCMAEGEPQPSERVMIMGAHDGIIIVQDGFATQWARCN